MPVAPEVAALFAVPALTVPVTLGAASTRGYLDDADQVYNDPTQEPAKQRQRTLGIATGSLGVITEHVSIVRVGVRGAAAVAPADPTYVVRDVVLLDDGELSQLVLVPELG